MGSHTLYCMTKVAIKSSAYGVVHEGEVIMSQPPWQTGCCVCYLGNPEKPFPSMGLGHKSVIVVIEPTVGTPS